MTMSKLGFQIHMIFAWKSIAIRSQKKVSKTLGLLRHTLSPCPKEVNSRAHQALVRPQLEYTAEAWNPHSIITADRFERIQRAAARFVHHDYRHTTSVDNLTNILGWNRLRTR